MMALYGWFKKEGSPEFTPGIPTRPAPKSKGPEHYTGSGSLEGRIAAEDELKRQKGRVYHSVPTPAGVEKYMPKNKGE